MVGRADMNEFWKDVVVGKGNDMRAPAGIIYGYISKLDFFISFASSSFFASLLRVCTRELDYLKQIFYTACILFPLYSISVSR